MAALPPGSASDADSSGLLSEWKSYSAGGAFEPGGARFESFSLSLSLPDFFEPIPSL